MSGWNRRPRDSNGWKIPADGTLSRKVYDLAVTGLSIKDISEKTGIIVTTANAMLAQIQPPKPRRPEVSESIASRPNTDEPAAGAPLDDAALDSLIDNLNAIMARNGSLPAAIEQTRQQLLYERLIRDMRKFVQRFDPDVERQVWDAFVGGLERSRNDIERKTGQPLALPAH